MKVLMVTIWYPLLSFNRPSVLNEKVLSRDVPRIVGVKNLVVSNAAAEYGVSPEVEEPCKKVRDEIEGGVLVSHVVVEISPGQSLLQQKSKHVLEMAIRQWIFLKMLLLVPRRTLVLNWFNFLLLSNDNGLQLVIMYANKI